MEIGRETASKFLACGPQGPGAIAAFNSQFGLRIVHSIGQVFALIGVCFLACGCSLAVSNIGPARKFDPAIVSLRDNRPDHEKKAERAGITSSTVELGDSNFQPSILDHLKSELANQKPEDTAHIEFNLSHFRIVDAFPHRMASAQAGGLAGVMASYGVSSVQQVSNDTDAIICVISGTLNGKQVAGEAATPYKTNALAVSVRNDANWIAAVKESLEQAVRQLYESIR